MTRQSQALNTLKQARIVALPSSNFDCQAQRALGLTVRSLFSVEAVFKSLSCRSAGGNVTCLVFVFLGLMCPRATVALQYLNNKAG